MTPNNNLSCLPFYRSLDEQNARKWWVHNRIYPLFTPANMLLPFQIMRKHKVLSALDERIPAEYIYRQSDPRLGNGPIQITKILGNTLVWNQLCPELNSTNWGTVSGVTASYSNGVATVSFPGSNKGLVKTNAIQLISGHRYYLAYSVYSPSATNYSFSCGGNSGVEINEDIPSSTLSLLHGITQSNTTVKNPIYIYTSGAVSGAKIYTPFICDLTLMFGETVANAMTVEKFEALYLPKNYSYNAGQLINNSAEGLEMVGFNKWDGVVAISGKKVRASDGVPVNDNVCFVTNYIRVVSGQTYFFNKTFAIGASSSGIAFYDSNLNYISGSAVTEYNTTYTRTAPANAFYMRVSGILDSTLISTGIFNISDPNRNGQYEPYKHSVLDLHLEEFQVKDAQGNIVTINGLKKYDDEHCDEIVGKHYTQRVGIRTYQSGDESNPSCITDGTNTYYPLESPIEYEIISDYPANYPIYYGYLNGTEEVKYTGTTPVAPIRYEATPYRLLNLFKIFKADGTELADYTEQMNRMLAVKTIDDIDMLVYAANIPFTPIFPNGQYYAVMSDGLTTWYSEMFTAVNDIQPYLKIEWWDVEDFVMDAGIIVYTEPKFKNILYLDSDLAKPEYPFEEEGETRDGYFFPIKQISEKHYRFKFFASEYLLDVMRFIRMADYAQITYHGQTYKLDTFLITPEWEDNGDVASVEAEFDTATVAKKIGRGYPIPSGGDFNDDFNNDFNVD